MQMYVYMYTCMYVYKYICVYVYVYIVSTINQPTHFIIVIHTPNTNTELKPQPEKHIHIQNHNNNTVLSLSKHPRPRPAHHMLARRAVRRGAIQELDIDSQFIILFAVHRVSIPQIHLDLAAAALQATRDKDRFIIHLIRRSLYLNPQNRLRSRGCRATRDNDRFIIHLIRRSLYLNPPNRLRRLSPTRRGIGDQNSFEETELKK